MFIFVCKNTGRILYEVECAQSEQVYFCYPFVQMRNCALCT